MSGSGEAGRRGGQDTAQISDCERKQIKGDIPGMSKIPKLTTWTQHVIREASSMAGAILGFPAAGFSVPRAPALAGHSPRCSCPDPLVLGPGATSPITERLTHLGWAVWSDQTAGQQQQQLSPASPFQKNNRSESNSGERQALQARMESQEPVCSAFPFNALFLFFGCARLSLRHAGLH